MDCHLPLQTFELYAYFSTAFYHLYTTKKNYRTIYFLHFINALLPIGFIKTEKSNTFLNGLPPYTATSGYGLSGQYTGIRSGRMPDIWFIFDNKYI